MYLSTRYCKLLNICWYLPEVWDLQKMLLEKRNIRKILGRIFYDNELAEGLS